MKIALIGSAPSSVRLAPYQNPEWQIWGCSPGAYPFAGPHADRWFELHRWEPQIPGHLGTGQAWFTPEYCEFLTRFRGPVMMLDPLPPEIPNATKLEIDPLIQEFGPYFFTSSLAWMFALAMTQRDVTDIGMWGVDMSATEEYGWQRAGCQYFVTIATQRGIKVHIPPESDLLQPPYWYGVTENTDFMIKMTARMRELKDRRNAMAQQHASALNQMNFLDGAIDDMNYMINTWMTKQAWIEPSHGKTGNEVRAIWTIEDEIRADQQAEDMLDKFGRLPLADDPEATIHRDIGKVDPYLKDVSHKWPEGEDYMNWEAKKEGTAD